ncbi:unnamed protein product [Brassica oleracea]
MYIKHASVPSATELPIERLIRAATPGNGSRASVGEDFVAMTKCRLHARNFMTQEGMTATKKMKRGTTAMPLSVYSLGGSVVDNCKQFAIAELESDRKPLIMVYNKKTQGNGLRDFTSFCQDSILVAGGVKSLWSRAYNGGTIKGDSQVYTTKLETTPCSERGSPFKVSLVARKRFCFAVCFQNCYFLS